MLKIVWRAVGSTRTPAYMQWPDSYPFPRVGEEIADNSGETWTVHGITYYPYGELDESEPFVYIRLDQ